MEKRNLGDNTHAFISGTSNMESRREILNLENPGDIGKSNIESGPDGDELTGLLVADRKRMRGGPDNYDTMDTPGGLGPVSNPNVSNKTADGGLSGLDCTSSNNSQLATLAKQASRTL